MQKERSSQLRPGASLKSRSFVKQSQNVKKKTQVSEHGFRKKVNFSRV